MHQYAKACGAKNPDALTSTRLRKHLATLSMNDGDIEQLSSFMGHTVNVHKNSYRLSDDVFQTAKISKLLVLMESGQAGNFKGQVLDDIEINLEEDLLEDSNSEGVVSEPIDSDDNINYSYNLVAPAISASAPAIDNSFYETKMSPNIFSAKKKRQKIPWTAEQKGLVKKIFATYNRKCMPPKRVECEDLLQRYPDIFRNKTWLKLKI